MLGSVMNSHREELKKIHTRTKNELSFSQVGIK